MNSADGGTATPHLRTKIMDSILSERAQRLFLLSDQERKGFINRKDMQRMRSEIPLSPEQLEAVFDSLDVKGNGYLTIEQFLAGFGQFLNSQSSSNGKRSRSVTRNGNVEHVYSSDDDIDSAIILQSQDEDDADHLEYVLQQLQSTNVLHNLDVLRQLCRRVQRDSSPQIQTNLESFLEQLFQDLKSKQRDHWELEESLRIREDEHNKQVQKLFEEMDSQLTAEKENFIKQEEQRLRLNRKVLEEELSRKEDFVRDVLQERESLSEQLQARRAQESNTEQLIRGKEELEQKLEHQCQKVSVLKANLDELERSEEVKRRLHLSSGFRFAHCIMLEQQGLLQQLQLVRKMVTTITDNPNSLDDETWYSDDMSRKCQDNTQYPSLETTSGFLDDYEYDEDFSHPIFQKTQIQSSSLPCLQEELALTQKMVNECEYSDRKQEITDTLKSCS